MTTLHGMGGCVYAYVEPSGGNLLPIRDLAPPGSDPRLRRQRSITCMPNSVLSQTDAVHRRLHRRPARTWFGCVFEPNTR